MGQKGAWSRSRELLFKFCYTANISGTAADTNQKFSPLSIMTFYINRLLKLSKGLVIYHTSETAKIILLWPLWCESGWCDIDRQQTRSYFSGFLRLCQFWWKSIKKCDRESARRRTDTHTHTHTHRHTDANRFYNLSHAICYSNGTDNNN